MQTEGMYEVRARVRTLADASKIIQLLDSVGYKEVGIGPPRPHLSTEMFAKAAEAIRGRLNKMVLRALQRLEAFDEKHGLEVEKMVEKMKNDHAHGDLVRCSPEGIIARTVSMVAPAVLAEKIGWVATIQRRLLGDSG